MSRSIFRNKKFIYAVCVLLILSLFSLGRSSLSPQAFTVEQKDKGILYAPVDEEVSAAVVLVPEPGADEKHAADMAGEFAQNGIAVYVTSDPGTGLVDERFTDLPHILAGMGKGCSGIFSVSGDWQGYVLFGPVMTRAEDVSVPVMVIHGTDDVWQSDESARVLAEQFQKGYYVSVEGEHLLTGRGLHDAVQAACSFCESIRQGGRS